ncbi:MAG TPA: PIN domain-containing protein [Bdellovibrionota bacterium]|nr:PIN domain-containing protein [Bdellovibrionota bacterium]
MSENRRAFFDTNILVYAYDRSDSGKSNRSSDLVKAHWENQSAATSLQVLQEFLVTVATKIPKPLSFEDAVDVCRSYFSWDPVVTTQEIFVHACRLRHRYRWSFWDAAIVAQALASNCDALYTEDLQHGFHVEDLRILNPFKE